MVELIAHRAGNSRDLADAFGSADQLEIDVHLHRGRLVVRHAKRIWLSSRLWERWYLLPPGVPVPELAEALTWVGPDQGLWIDCKGGLGRRLPTEVCRVCGPDRPITLSTKAWWLLGRPVRGLDVRTVRSAGNRAELFLLRRVPSRVAVDGVALHRRLATAPLVAELKRRHGLVFCWSVPDEATARRLLAWGVDGLILDDPALAEALADAGVDPQQPRRERH